MQVAPASAVFHPVLHAQVKDAAVLAQAELDPSQLWVVRVHSSTSAHGRWVDKA